MDLALKANEKNEVMLEHCTLWLRKDAVLMVSPFEGANIGFREARKIMDTICQLSQQTSRSIVFDLRPAHNIDMAARILITGERFASVKNSVALIVPSLIAKLVTNFTLMLDRPTFPVKAFIRENEALEWSRQRSVFALPHLA